MKKLFFALLIAPVLLISSCLNDDGYSNEGLWASFGIVKKKNTSSEYQIITDKGNILDPVSFGNYDRYKYGYDDGFADWKDGDRVLIYFNILDENPNPADTSRYYIRINTVKKILMKKIITLTPTIQDSIGNDPVQVLDAWVTDSLMNFKIQYYGKYKTHYINLVNPNTSGSSGSGPVELELRHNKNDDLEEFSFVSYVSFRLTSLKKQNTDSVRFTVRAKEYDNREFVFTASYKY